MLRGLLAWLLTFALFLLASAVALNVTVGNPAYVKEMLVKSGVYTTFVGSAIKLAYAQNVLDPVGTTASKIPLTELAPVVSRVITPQFLQTTTETMVNSTFSWLSGSQKTLIFTIPVSDVKARLRPQVAGYIKDRVDSLPVCAKTQNYQNYDPLSATCKPPIALSNADIDSSANTFIASLPLLQDETISSETTGLGVHIANSSTGRIMPAVYQWAKRIPLILIPLIAVCFVVLLATSHRRHKRLKTIGHTFLWAGGLLIIFGAITLFIDGNYRAGFIGTPTQEQLDFVNAVFLPITQPLTKSLALISLYFGVGYVLIASVCYAISHRLRINYLRTIGNDENNV